MFRKSYIYGLIDPSDNTIKYVGKANYPNTRLNCHWYSGKNPRGKDTPFIRWMIATRAKKIKPVLIVLDECYRKDWEEFERFWISYFKYIGANILNSHKGGEPSGYHNKGNLLDLKKGGLH